jgi:hypothetical protein
MGSSIHLGVERTPQFRPGVEVRPEFAPVSVHVGGGACGDCPEQFDEGEFSAPAGAVDVDYGLDPFRGVLANWAPRFVGR